MLLGEMLELIQKFMAIVKNTGLSLVTLDNNIMVYGDDLGRQGEESISERTPISFLESKRIIGKSQQCIFRLARFC